MDETAAMLRPTHTPALADGYRRAGFWRGETIWQVFATTAAARGTRVAIVEGALRTSWVALAAAAERVAGGLAALGVGPGDVVAVQLPNWTETVVALLAAARLGAVPTPILPILRRRELGFVLRASGARVLVVPGRYRDADHRVLAGVLHSHDTLLAEARSLKAVHALSPADVVLMPSPLTHVSGLVHALLVPAVLGTTAVLMERWDPAAALELIARERVTYMVGAPTFLRDLAFHPTLPAHDVHSLRLFSCGGADVDPALVREAAARLGCVQAGLRLDRVSDHHHDRP